MSPATGLLLWWLLGGVGVIACVEALTILILLIRTRR